MRFLKFTNSNFESPVRPHIPVSFSKSIFARHALLTSVLRISAPLFLFCAPPPATDPFVYRNEGIQIDVKADHLLNTYDGEAHSVKIAVYQLTNNTAFLERSKTRDGCNELLRSQKFDPSVIHFEQAIAKPNDSRLITIDRIAGAKWIGVIAGYYKPSAGLPPSLLIEIPTAAKRKNFIRRFGEFTGLMTPSDIRYVPTMLVELVLTPQTMYETSIFR